MRDERFGASTTWRAEGWLGRQRRLWERRLDELDDYLLGGEER